MKIGIISLGLIGGSILKSLAQTENEIYAVTRNKDSVQGAKDFTPFVSDDINILKDCGIVFVCSPINKIPEMLDRLENCVNKDCIVLDCAGVKEFVSKKRRPYKFIPSHPMAGTEKSGFSASFPGLFKDAVWVLTPFENTAPEDIQKAENIIKLTGARTLKMTAKDHDRAAALISHFPMLLAQALFYCIKDNKTAKLLASSGFRDMTRLAASNLQMGLDMLNFNAENIDFAQKELFKSLEFLKNTKDFQILSEIKTERLKMYSAEGKNVYGVSEKE